MEFTLGHTYRWHATTDENMNMNKYAVELA